MTIRIALNGCIQRFDREVPQRICPCHQPSQAFHLPQETLGTYWTTGGSQWMMIRKLSLTIALCSIAIGPVHAESGMASFYGSGDTASGEASSPTGITAAHRSLPSD